MFLKTKIIIFKIRRSKVTDYAALSDSYPETVADTPRPQMYMFCVKWESGQFRKCTGQRESPSLVDRVRILNLRVKNS